MSLLLKNSLLLYFILLICYSNGQTPITVQSISFDGEYDKYDLYSITLFQNGDTIQWIEDPYFNKLILTKDINYQLEYYDILLQKNLIELTLDDIVSDTLFICPDCISHNNKNKKLWVLKASKKKPISIQVESYGCFHATHDSLEFFKQKGNYYINYNDTLRTINQNDLIHIINFEKELKIVKGGGCTTKDHYTLQFNNKSYKKTDDGCEWDGFWNLLDRLSIPIRKYKPSGWW